MVGCLCVYLCTTEERPFILVHRLRSIHEVGVMLFLRGVPVTCKVDITERYTTRSKVRLCDIMCVCVCLHANSRFDNGLLIFIHIKCIHLIGEGGKSAHKSANQSAARNTARTERYFTKH